MDIEKGRYGRMNWKEIKDNRKLLIIILASAGCITVVVYLLLKHFGVVSSALQMFVGFFSEVIIGGILAYLMNPIAVAIKKSVFKKTKLKDGGWGLSIAVALIIVLFLIAFLLGLVLPQLIDSVMAFADQFVKYYPTLTQKINDMGFDLSKLGITTGKTLGTLDETIDQISSYALDNSSTILEVLLGAGKGMLSFSLAVIMAVYFIADKDDIKTGSIRFLKALVNEEHAENVIGFLKKCSDIFLHYTFFSLVEGVLIGVINAIFMLIMGLPYISLVSVLVGLTNLIPTVGPLIGGVVGAFVILVENPVQALIFLIFTVVLQFFDGYILKPKLFGNSLGVSGTLIMIAFLVGGNMFGIVGMLLSIPGIAIIDMIYHEYILKGLEKRRNSQKMK